jgi:hypothetical protein
LVRVALVWQVMGLVLADYPEHLAPLVLLILRVAEVAGITQKLLHNGLAKMVALAVAEAHQEQIFIRVVLEHQDKETMVVLMVE